MKCICSGILILLSFSIIVNAQNTPYSDSLHKQLAASQTNKDKVYWLGQLAQWYSGINEQVASDYAHRELQVAEASLNNKLRYKAFFDNAGTQLNSTSKWAIDSAMYFTQKAVKLAKDENNQEYQGWATIFLAYVANVKGEKEKELSYVSEANSIAEKIHKDSLHWVCTTILAGIYDSKKERLPAFRNYMKALNIAEESGNEVLTLGSYFYIVDFYYDLGNYNKAKEYASEALELTFKLNNAYERINLYDKIGLIYTDDKLYDTASSFFEKGLQLADTLQSPFRFRVQIYNHIMRQYFLMGAYDRSYDFFIAQKDFQQFLIENRYGYFVEMLRARLFVYTGKTDSAAVYFKKAEPLVDSLADDHSKNMFYDWYGDYFHKKGDIANAIVYFTKAKNICEKSNDLVNLLKETANLDSMYLLIGDYKSAYNYNNLHTLYKDSLQKLANEKELTSAEIDQEILLREKTARQEELATQRRHNIQYMGITAALAVLIILLVMAGFFSLSLGTIEALGFFTFIFLFEFIIILTDEKIHEFTHGEPWKIVLIKILLACMVVPLHHYSEHKVIGYFSAHKLINPKKKRNEKVVVIERAED